MKEEYGKETLFFSYFFGTIVFHFRSPEAKEQTPKKTKEKKKKTPKQKTIQFSEKDNPFSSMGRRALAIFK